VSEGTTVGEETLPTPTRPGGRASRRKDPDGWRVTETKHRSNGCLLRSRERYGKRYGANNMVNDMANTRAIYRAIQRG
jgi:hypothetical protein